jgi:sporulation protein YlmC with PRC-barrel domain
MSAVGTQVDLGLRLLDDQLLDAEEDRCGRVDDIQLKGSPGSKTEVSALLVGPGAWGERLRRPFSSLLDGLAPRYMHVIPWSEVTAVSTAVRLASTAEELGLESKDGRNVQWVGYPPRGTMRVSELLRSKAVTRGGRPMGRIWDLRAERQTKLPDERVNESWRVVGLIVGKGAWRERIGLYPEGEPNEDRAFVPWTSVEDVGEGVVTLSDAVLG